MRERMNLYLKAGWATQIETKRKVNTQQDILRHQDVQVETKSKSKSGYNAFYETCVRKKVYSRTPPLRGTCTTLSEVIKEHPSTSTRPVASKIKYFENLTVKQSLGKKRHFHWKSESPAKLARKNNLHTRGPSINYSEENLRISHTTRNYFVGSSLICRRDQTEILDSEGRLSGTLEEAGGLVTKPGLKD